jgi:hypothetical protein
VKPLVTILGVPGFVWALGAFFLADVGMEGLRLVTCSRVLADPPPKVCQVQGSTVATFWVKLGHILAAGHPAYQVLPLPDPVPAPGPLDRIRQSGEL